MKGIDTIDRHLIEALSKDSRMAVKTLAEHVGLSAPSVSERIKRLEERGVIAGFGIEIDPEILGYTMQAIVRIRPLPGKLHIVQKLIAEMPQIVECDKVTGEDCFFARLYVRSIAQLDGLLDAIADKAETNTAIVKSQPVTRRLPPLS